MLKIEHLTKHYAGTDKGITDISLHIQAGDLFAFVGHNGAGKTTALKVVTGIHKPNSGTVTIDGLSLAEHPLECKRRFAYIPDNPDLYTYLTGIQYLNFIADVFAVPANTRTARIAQYADDFELTDALGELISAYSHGMKQKLAIVAALLHAPRLLILDEPFVGLDPKSAVMLKAHMRALCKAGGAVFFSTHVLEVAQKLCNKVAILKNGRIVANGDMQALTGDRTLEDLFMEVAVDEP